MRSRLVRRAVVAVGLFAVADVTLVLLDLDPVPGRLALLVGLVVAADALLREGLGETAAGWEAPSPPPAAAAGADPRLASYVRQIEGHLAARHPGPALRDRLAAVCDRRLAARGLSRDDPSCRERVEELLGPALLADLEGPPRRWGPRDIDDHLRRIEEL